MNPCAVGNSLVTLMCHLFNVYDLIQHFQLDMVKLHRFLGKLRGSVGNNSINNLQQDLHVLLIHRLLVINHY